jgi:hypothetical protein
MSQESTNEGPKIESNIAFVTLQAIKKHSTEAFLSSLIAVSMIDNTTRDLELTVSYVDNAIAQTVISDIIASFLVYKPVPIYVRSYKVNGVFQRSLDGNKFEQTSVFPQSTDDYKGKKAVVDIEKTSSSCVYYVYKWNEVKPRILRINVLTDDSQIALDITQILEQDI